MEHNFVIEKTNTSTNANGFKKADMFINISLNGISGSISLYADKDAKTINAIKEHGMDNKALLEYLTKKLVITSIRDANPSERASDLFDDFNPSDFAGL